MITINESIQKVSAFAPATCANVAVGFDILGFALEHVGDIVTLTRRDDKQIIIDNIESQDSLPRDPDKNTASLVIKRVIQDFHLDIGFNVHIQKGIPMSAGMGGSAASAVAALIACNAFLTPTLSREQLAYYALIGEAASSGQPHPDNIIPCLWGGLTLIQSMQPMNIISLPIPDIYCVLVHPHLHVATQEARSILKPQVSLTDVVKQTGNLATFIAALYQNDNVLLKKSLQDILIEPQRAAFVPGFFEIKQAAFSENAIGVSFSGSGPSVFAFAKTQSDSKKIAKAMRAVLTTHTIRSDAWISRISQQAAHVIQAS